MDLKHVVYAHVGDRFKDGGMEEREGGMKGESSMETYMLPYVKQTASGNFPYDSGNSNWSSVTI